MFAPPLTGVAAIRVMGNKHARRKMLRCWWNEFFIVDLL